MRSRSGADEDAYSTVFVQHLAEVAAGDTARRGVIVSTVSNGSQTGWYNDGIIGWQ
jgi:hypothetical protein